MNPRNSVAPGQRARTRMSNQSAGGRARGRRASGRPPRGGGSSGFQPFDGSQSFRSDATASPDAPQRASERPQLTDLTEAPSAARSGSQRRVTPPASAWASMSNAAWMGRASRIVNPGFYTRFRRWWSEAFPYHWRERPHHRNFWRRRAIPAALIVVGVVVVVILGNLGFSAIQQATRAFASSGAFNNSSSSQPATPGSVFISPLNNSAGSPTPTATAYSLGIWTSEPNPAGATTVFIHVTNASQPVANVKVYLQVNGGGNIGPLITDKAGIASRQIGIGGGGGPVTLTAETTIKGVTYSGSYTFYAG